LKDLDKPINILITGATGSIGGALALIYAEPGVSLILQGRNEARLDTLAHACEELGATVITHAINLRDRQAVANWLNELCASTTLDLVIVNAGMNTDIGPDGKGEQWQDVEALIDVNVLAAMLIADTVIPNMRQRKQGQIVFISSLAAYFGLPVTPSYSASKAAIKAYGEALRGWLAPEGIQVNVVMPGYVKSPMCDAMPGPKPFMWPPSKAAKVIKRGLAKNKARISFPFPLNLGTWFLAVLPASFSIQILRWIGYNGVHRE
jgi:short-subunit dehydrogenase